MAKFSGIVQGKVASEPDGIGRVRVRLAWMEGESESYWAHVAAIMTGPGRGVWFMPEIDDDVLVAFDQNNADIAYIIGFLWNGVDRPPTTDGNVRLIRSVNGHEITIYDPQVAGGDTGYISIADAHGNEIILQNANISIRSTGTINIQAPNVIINGRPVAVAPKPI